MRTASISPERLLADLGELRRIGGRADGGVERVAGSPADLEARRWLAGRFHAGGLEARADMVNNVFGRAAGSAGPWLLLGSHTDTVPAGGWLDGAYGVVAALEVLRTLRSAAHPAAGAIEVVSFHDEEGVTGGGLAGSRHLASHAHASELTGYLELHIEQGPRLDREGLELGVVEGIVGIDRWRVRVLGVANHAGTTPYELRHDAGSAAASVIARLRSILAEVNPEMVGNVGEVAFLPGAANVVPGEAVFTVELRSLRAEALEQAAGALQRALAQAAADHACSFEMEPASSTPPAPMDAGVIVVLEQTCARTGRGWRRLASGAGHDAGVLAPLMPAGMLFVPSLGGISHSPAEDTPPELLAMGAQVLLEAAVALAPQA